MEQVKVVMDSLFVVEPSIYKSIKSMSFDNLALHRLAIKSDEDDVVSQLYLEKVGEIRSPKIKIDFIDKIKRTPQGDVIYVIGIGLIEGGTKQYVAPIFSNDIFLVSTELIYPLPSFRLLSLLSRDLQTAESRLAGFENFMKSTYIYKLAPHEHPYDPNLLIVGGYYETIGAVPVNAMQYGRGWILETINTNPRRPNVKNLILRKLFSGLNVTFYGKIAVLKKVEEG